LLLELSSEFVEAAAGKPQRLRERIDVHSDAAAA
jgi:hypothetical protein